MSFVGDFKAGTSFNKKFTTVDSTGAPVSFTGSPTVVAYKNNDTTESSSGITLTTNFDSRTGLHNIQVDLSQNTSFYISGSDFDLVMTAGTAGGVGVVGYIPASFSVEHRSTTLASATTSVLQTIADALLDRDMSLGTDSGSSAVRTTRQALRSLRNKVAVTNSVMTVYKENDSTSSWSADVVADATAQPIVTIDPT